MGQDATIFARSAKKSFYFDRDYNLKGWLYGEDDAVTDQEIERGWVLHHKSYGPKGALSYDEAIEYCDLSLKGYRPSSGTLGEPPYWTRKVLHFIKDHPGDTFFILMTNDADYYDIDDQYTKVNEGDLP